MILIVDSGSTKTEFRLIDDQKRVGEKSFMLRGVNPFYQSEQEIRELIHKDLYPELREFEISKIYFYGAGCNFPEKKELLKRIFVSFFPKAEIYVDSDLLAASRALFGTNRGIACILGTGSNSCLYNGTDIERHVSPLGFILGDEGSGAVLGRKFIADCLKNQLPLSLRDKFFAQYQTSPVEIMERVYRQPFPNRYLASFSPFLLENIQEEPIYYLVRNSFTEFFERNIKQYDAKDLELGFVGSIAYYFQDILKEVADKQGYKVNKIIQNPMMDLCYFYQKEAYTK